MGGCGSLRPARVASKGSRRGGPGTYVGFSLSRLRASTARRGIRAGSPPAARRRKTVASTFRVILIWITTSTIWKYGTPWSHAMAEPTSTAPPCSSSIRVRPPGPRRSSSDGEAQSGPGGLDRDEQRCRASPLVSYKVGHPTHINLQSQIPCGSPRRRRPDGSTDRRGGCSVACCQRRRAATRSRSRLAGTMPPRAVAVA